MAFPALFRSDWNRSLFIHFEVEPSALQPVVPLPLDLLADRAYVSLVAFSMDRLRPVRGGRLAALLVAPIASHPFLNVRTYVRHEGEPGIYFMSEWLPNRLSVLLGPRTYGLPYRFGRLQYNHDHGHGLLTGSVIPADAPGHVFYRAQISADAVWRASLPGSRDEFLIERYAAFTHVRGVSRRFDIRHPPWLQAAVQIEFLDASLIAATGDWHQSARVVGANYSPGVTDVAISPPRRLRLRCNARRGVLSPRATCALRCGER